MSGTTDSYKLDSRVVAKVKTPLLLVTAIGWVLCLIGFIIPSWREQTHFSYHTAFMFGTTITLGSLFFVIAQRLTTAGWSVVVRRLAETVMANLPIIAVLFIPVLIGVLFDPGHGAGHGEATGGHHRAYFEWASGPGNDHLLQKKAPYLNINFFVVRAIIYLVIWSFLGWTLYRRSTAQDVDGNAQHSRSAFKWSAAGLPLFFLSGTFAAFDWLMSLSPHWFSTVFGIYTLAGGAVGFMATLILISLWLRNNGVLKHSITTEHYHDLGKLLFAFNVFWAYIAFSQYFLIWYANLPEETFYFKDRQAGSWMGVSALLAVGHFILPFAFMLPRSIKRNQFTLALAAGWMLLMHYVDTYWMVMPQLHRTGLHLHILDLAALLAVVGTLTLAFLSRVQKQQLVPVNDPFLAESLAFENA